MDGVERLRTRALLARSVDYGEADRILTLLTEDAGKVSALARSARRSRRRFGGALSLFVVGQAELGNPRRGSDLRPLERFDPLSDLAGAMGADLAKVTHGSYVLELARELWPAESTERELFALVLTTLEAIAAHEPSPTLLRCFELALLANTGHLPSFDRCVRCDELVDAQDLSPSGFSVTSGGVICAGCGPHGWPLSEDARRAAMVLLAVSPHRAAQEALPARVALELRELSMMVLRHHVGHDLQSWQFMGQFGSRST